LIFLGSQRQRFEPVFSSTKILQNLRLERFITLMIWNIHLTPLIYTSLH